MNTVLAEHVLPTGQTIQILQGDITTEPVDAIVNAANPGLQHGGGVARAILTAGGQVIQQESDDWVRSHGLVPHSHPAWTSAGRLPARYVIHAVGPVWGEGDEDVKLTDAIRSALRAADERMAASVALPALSTGIFGFPKDRAAGIIFKSIRAYFSENSATGIEIVKLVLFDQSTVDAFMNSWIGQWGP